MRDVLTRVVTLNSELAAFWKNAKGWTPKKADRVLSGARLDWQIELSRTLRLWLRKPAPDEVHATLILGWTNLGALVEGSLKLYLAVWADAYARSPHAIPKQRGKPSTKAVSHLMAGELLDFMKAMGLLKPWHDWLTDVLARRNAIHSFRERALGDRTEFQQYVRAYLDLLRTINDHLPYPEGGAPAEAKWRFEPRSRPPRSRHHTK